MEKKLDALFTSPLPSLDTRESYGPNNEEEITMLYKKSEINIP